MAENEDLDLEDEAPEGDTQEPAPQQTQDANYWRVRAEKAERKAKRTSEYLTIQSKYPGVTLDDLAGVDVRHWERIASRLSAPSAPTGDEQTEQAAGEQAAPQAASVPQEAVQAARQFTATAAGTGPAASQTISFEEALKLGGPSNPQVRDMIRNGQVEGVKAPPR